MKYGVYIEDYQGYEAWMEKFDTLKEARACVIKWQKKDKPKREPIRIVLVRLLSEHEEGDLL